MLSTRKFFLYIQKILTFYIYIFFNILLEYLLKTKIRKMKNFIFISFVIFIQLFIAVRSRAIDSKEVSIIYEHSFELEKYKGRKNDEWEVENLEVEVDTPENNIIKRMALEDDEEFEAKIQELANISEEKGDEEDIVDEVPNEFPHPDDRLVKRASISSSEYFRSQLSSFEKKIYDAVNNIFNKSTISTLVTELKGIESFKIKKANIQTYSSKGVGAIVRDHPEYWWIKKYNISYSTKGGYLTKLSLTINSGYSISQINSYKAKVKSKATSIATAAKKKSGTYNRLLYIHDYLVKYIKYKDGADYSYNIYGALLKNSCACEGYAESFAYISRLISVPTICVSSSSHKWNYVYIKKWYAVDVTFDDPTVNGVTYSSGDSKNLSHKFFLVGSNTVIKKDKTYTTYSNRKLVSYLEFPSATGFKYPTLSTTAYQP